MTREPDNQLGDGFQRLGSIGFISGAVLVMLGSIWLPTVDLSNVLEAQKKFGEQALRLQACALLITIGYWAIMMGTASLHSAIATTGVAWARLGFYFHLVGVVLWTLGMSLDVSYPAAIVAWAAAPAADKDVAYSVVTTLSPAGFGRGLFPMNVTVNWLAFAFLSTGMVLNAAYPRWLGSMGLVTGIAGVILGMIMTFTGRERLITPFIVLWVVTTIWWSLIGIWMARKEWLSKRMK